MEQSLNHTISLLTRTPAALHALLRDLPEAWTFRNEGENTWSAFDVVGHLIHGERTDWMPRARIGDRNERVKVSPCRSCWMNSPVCGQKTWANCVH